MKGGPAPNAYKLPPAFGYNFHDGTKYRNPAYTIREQLPGEPGKLGPSLYNVRGKTRFGVNKAPAYSIKNVPHDIYIPQAPPPTSYSPEKFTSSYKPRAPEYTMGHRTGDKFYESSPGPSAYKLPPVLGPKVPDKHCNGAFTILGKAQEAKGEGHPAPNRYYPSNLSVYKRSAPKYTMSQRIYPPDFQMQVPAPSKYNAKPVHLKSQPGFSFGSKHSDNTGVYLTVEDINTPYRKS